jgi:deoxyribodipyrimidine photolyase
MGFGFADLVIVAGVASTATSLLHQGIGGFREGWLKASRQALEEENTKLLDQQIVSERQIEQLIERLKCSQVEAAQNAAGYIQLYQEVTEALELRGLTLQKLGVHAHLAPHYRRPQ